MTTAVGIQRKRGDLWWLVESEKENDRAGMKREGRADPRKREVKSR